MTILTSPGIWFGISTDQGIFGATYGGGFVYAGTYKNPASVFKIDPSTMRAVAMWTGAAGEQKITCMAYIGGYVYAGLDVTPGKVIKIDPATMLTVAEWTGAAGVNRVNGLTFDGTNLYVSLFTTPAIVVKVDPATMTTVGFGWAGIAGQDYGGHLEWDGTYIYVPLYISPAQVVKIDPTTMTTSGVWTGAANENLGYGLCYDGSYIFAGMADLAFLSKVIKIDPATMTTVAPEWVGPLFASVNWLTYAGGYIYAPLEVIPGKVIKISPSTMTTVSEWTGADVTQNCLDVLPSDGTYLYGGVADPAFAHTMVIKIDPATMITAMVPDVKVDASFDDVLRIPSEAAGWYPTLAQLGVGYSTAFQPDWGSGLRFTNITIPKNETITAAYLTITCHDAFSNTVVRSYISAEGADNPPTFADVKAAFDVRFATHGARIAWDNLPAWVVDTEYQSVDISAVIQGQVNRAGWASGNAIVLFWEDFDKRSTPSGATLRAGYQWDATRLTKVVRLHVEYSVFSPKGGSVAAKLVAAGVI